MSDRFEIFEIKIGFDVGEKDEVAYATIEHGKVILVETEKQKRWRDLKEFLAHHNQRTGRGICC